MSIQTEINRIKQSKENIISALETKGVTVPSDASIDDLSALVDAIEVATDPVLQSKTVTPSTSSQTVTPDSGYDGLSQVTVNAMPTATQATPTISVSSSGLITASATQTAGYVSAGTKSATNQLTTKGATTYTPTTSNQTIASGTYLTGTQTIEGDANLVADNIKSGVSIFGITGTLESSSGGSTSGLQMVEGTFTPTTTGYATVTVTGIPFTPKYIFIALTETGSVSASTYNNVFAAGLYSEENGWSGVCGGSYIRVGSSINFTLTADGFTLSSNAGNYDFETKPYKYIAIG